MTSTAPTRLAALESERTIEAQNALLALSAELEKIDAALESVIDSLDGVDGCLPLEMVSVADAVRRDLLADAVLTLRLIGHANAATVRARQLEVRGASEILLAGTA